MIRRQQMSYEMKLVAMLRQFMVKYPKTDYNNLDGLVKHISRQFGLEPVSILAVALTDRKSANYLLGALKKLEN
jgi:hypothetical protein